MVDRDAMKRRRLGQESEAWRLISIQLERD